MVQVQLKPLIDQLGRVKDLSVPELEGLQAWLLRMAANQAANGDHNSNDPSKSMNGYGGTPMPYVGETKVQSLLSIYFKLIFSFTLHYAGLWSSN